MLLHELVKTASMQVVLWTRRRDFRRLRCEFPPRDGKSPFWPALALLAFGIALFVLRARH